ncbi:(3,5-dihydroxyphenyl)acetyl-CoA 1,2-dioxygenase DpgC [Streptomyces sp. NPDC021969]|uniref:(3,5-dihydroxyphenyl)acetyl-CoA 1,2-dioxygenase DpgC n=1 Tax=unclassified Streptomyces TaxID=2593676 RepID=UPI0033EA90FC
MTAATRPDSWSATGDLAADAASLASVAADCERGLDTLPTADARTPDQRAGAAGLHRTARLAREAFLRAHADAVYDALTASRTLHPRVPELLAEAAERFPGLVPGAARLKAEEGLPQAHKEGWEVDQGLFLRHVLGSPVAGRHLLESMLRPVERSAALLGRFRETGRVELEKLTLERIGPAAHLTVHNPDCLNAEDNELADDMDVAVDLVLLDPRVRVGVLRGGVMTHPRYAGRRVFSAGINLAHLHEGRISYSRFLIGRELGYISKMYRGVVPVDDDARRQAWPHRRLQKPWLAAVDGFAIGGGGQLLLAVDHVVAAADAYFSVPAAQEGIVPGVANLRLSRLTGGRLARRVLLDGAKIRATSPEAGLVFDEVVEPDRMDTAIEAAVERLAAPAVASNRRMVHVAEEPLDAFRDYMAEFALEQALRLNSDDVLAKVGRRSAKKRAS